MSLSLTSRQLMTVLCFFILMMGAFSGPLDVSEGGSGETAMRVAKAPSVLLKLVNAGMACLVGLWGLASLPSARKYLASLPGLVLCMIALIFLMTCLTSITSASLPIALVFIAYLLLIPTCLVVLDLRGSMAAVLAGCLLFTCAALFLYYFVPRLGVFIEEFDDGVIIERLGGLSQPNHTGRTALIGLLLTTYFVRLRSLSWRVSLGLFTLFLLAGVLAMSRTAMLGVAICLVVLNLDLIFTRVGLTACWLGVVGGLAGLFVLLAMGGEEALAKKVLGAVTKTGDLEEVTQVTGRSDIWERTIKLIRGRPLQGYGLGANKIMLIDHLQSTHNILLHPTLAAGIFAGGLTLLLLLWNLANVFTYPNLLIRALSAYILISGLTEDTIYETFPGACTLLWIICCLWPIERHRPQSDGAGLLSMWMRPRA
ncbi:MAG: O-antigen ligase family protein [Pirellulaceae bacterium]|nr:O-antigen ligase family protein [Pirellulaceae bacterium]